MDTEGQSHALHSKILDMFPYIHIQRHGHRSISYVPLPRIVEHKECIHVRSCRLAATFPPIVATYGYPLLFEGGFAAGFRLQGSGKVVDMGRGGGGQNAQHTIIHAWKAGI